MDAPKTTNRNEFRFVFYTQKYEETVVFYRDSLEFPVAGGWDRSPDDRGTLLRVASGTVEVMKLPSGLGAIPPQGIFMAVEVGDVDERYRRARGKGLRIQQELQETAWGFRQFSILDPNDIKVVLFERLR